MSVRSRVPAAIALALALCAHAAHAADAPSRLDLQLTDENGRPVGSLIPVAPDAAPVFRRAPADATHLRRDSGVQPGTVQVQVIADDLVVQGSECVGFDCTAAETFGYDTIRLKENNVRIKFEDTSAASSFPGNDWSLRANDTNDGGRNGFFIDDDSFGRTPFAILAGAPNNSFTLAASGFLGFGIAAPTAKLHAVYGDTPTLRLDQDGSIGYSSQIWDLGGNEVGFFVRDLTGGGALAFRVLPGAPNAGLVAAVNGVGIGTLTPQARLHVVGTGADLLRAVSSSGAAAMTLDNSGNMVLSGILLESSSRTLKTGLEPVDAGDVLDRVRRLDLYEWSYKADAPSTRHIGPVAEDFAALFEVGADDRHISALDASGVALSAIQALDQQVRAKDARIADLEARLGAEQARIEALSRRLEALDRRLSAK